MSRAHQLAVRTLVIAAALAAPLLAHGGGHNPPKSGPPTIAPPTSGPGGAAGAKTGAGTSRGVGPGEANSQPGTAASGKGGAARRSSGSGNTTGATSPVMPERTTWEFWWDANQDEFLDLKARLAQRGVVSGGAGHLTGRGRKADGLSDSRRTAEQVRREIVPTLQLLLVEEDDANILDSSAVALGRIADASMSSMIPRVLEGLAGHDVLEVRWSAVLGMGVLGAPDHLPLLVDLMGDTSAGRAIAGGAVDWQVRAFSALALGYLDDPRAIRPLMDVVQNAPDSDRDLKACAVLGLGLMTRGPIDEISFFLRQRLEDPRVDPPIRAQIPIALGRLGDPSALAPLLAEFVDRDADRLVQQSIAIAFGRLATLADRPIVEALLDAVAQGPDEATRHFALIALGKIGARSERRQETDALHLRVCQMFADEIHEPTRRTDRSWSMLAGALWARGQPDDAPRLVARLLDAYEQEKDPSFKAAAAIALALAGAQEAAPAIYADYLASGDQAFQGYSALALGILRHGSARDPLRQACASRTIDPWYRRQAAVALGLIGDPEAVGVLVEVLRTSDTVSVSGAVVEALGLIGDREAVDLLTALATDDSIGALTRALACVALGRVGEKTDLPWNAPIRIDANYLLEIETVTRAAGIL